MPKISLPIDFRIEHGAAGLVHLTSPSHRDLFVSGVSIEEVMKATPAMINAINDAYESKNR